MNKPYFYMKYYPGYTRMPWADAFKFYSLRGNKPNMKYRTEKLFTVEARHYDDGVTFYELSGQDKDGNVWTEGLYNEIDLLIKVLKHIGKIDMSAKVYLSKDCPTPPKTDQDKK